MATQTGSLNALYKSKVSGQVLTQANWVKHCMEDESLVNDLVTSFIDDLSDKKEINTSNFFRYNHWIAKVLKNDDIVLKLVKRHVELLIKYEIFSKVTLLNRIFIPMRVPALMRVMI